MEEKEANRLIRLFDLFCDPVFVKKHGHVVPGYDAMVLTLNTKVVIGLLGMVTLSAVYSPRVNIKKAYPVIFLNDLQLNTLRERNFHLIVKRRKHPTGDETCMCFPDRNIFMGMISL